MWQETIMYNPRPDIWPGQSTGANKEGRLGISPPTIDEWSFRQQPRWFCFPLPKKKKSKKEWDIMPRDKERTKPRFNLGR